MVRPSSKRVRYEHIYISGHARAHLGDTYYYVDDADAEKNKILEWLSPLNPSASHGKAWGQYRQGTLGWFLEDARSQDWCGQLRYKERMTLWCRGDIGSGKTTLVAKVVDHLQSNVPANPLAVFYCRHDERSDLTAESVLGSILAQIYQSNSSATPSLEIPQDVKKMFEKSTRYTRVPPSLEKLQTWLEHQAINHGPLFLVLDAVNEMKGSERHKLLQALPSESIRLLVTSIGRSDTLVNLPNIRDIIIRASEEDLENLICFRLAISMLWERHHGDAAVLASTKGYIVSHIIGNSKQNFLLASLYLQRVMECTEIGDVRPSLERFPLDLDRYYQEAWTRATSRSSELAARRATLILMWVTLTEHPLTIEALQQALLHSADFTEDTQTTPDSIVAHCAGLLYIDRVRDEAAIEAELEKQVKGRGFTVRNLTKSVVRFTHGSAQAYLENRQGEIFPHAHDIIVASCLRAMTPSIVMFAVLPEVPLLSEGTFDNPAVHSVSPLFVTIILHGAKAFHPENSTAWLKIMFSSQLWAHWMMKNLARPAYHPTDAGATICDYGSRYLRPHVIKSSLPSKGQVCKTIVQSSQIQLGIVLLCVWPVTVWSAWNAISKPTIFWTFHTWLAIQIVWLWIGRRTANDEVARRWRVTISRMLTVSYVIALPIFYYKNLENLKTDQSWTIEYEMERLHYTPSPISDLAKTTSASSFEHT